MKYKWEHNNSTGNDIADIDQHTRIFRFKWAGAYVYCAGRSSCPGENIRGLPSASIAGSLEALKKAINEVRD